MAITTERLLRGVKRKPTMVANNQLLTDSDLLELADDSMRDLMVPLIKSLDGNFLLATPTTTALVAGTDTYDIPYRAIGRKLRNLKCSNDGTAENVGDMTLIDDDKIQEWSVTGQPGGFYYVGDQLVVRPNPVSSSGYLELWWYMQPSQLVQLSAAAKLASDPVAGVCTVTALPSTMTAGVTCDFVQGRSGNRIYAIDKTITATGANTITFAVADIPAALVQGDYIALSQQTPVLQIPDEAHPLLESDIVARALYSVGDFEGEEKVRREMVATERRLKMLLEPRTDQAPVKLVNRSGLLRRRYTTRRGLYF